jgi:hypothetical protein
MSTEMYAAAAAEVEPEAELKVANLQHYSLNMQ